MIATLREPATAAPAAPGGGIPEVPARVAGTVSAVRVSAGFTSPHQLRVELAEGGTTVIDFEQAIIAAGSEPLTLPFIPASDPRIMDSTGALEVGEVPERLLILGGGIMGLEMATVYHELSAKVTIAELMDQLIPGADKDLISLLAKRITRQYENVYLKTKVTDVQARPEGLVVSFDGPNAPATSTLDRMLVAVGRSPNGKLIAAESADAQSMTAASSRWTSNCGPTWRISSPSATSSASPCWRTRPCTKARSPPRSRRARTASSTPRSSPRSPTPTRRRPGPG